MRLVSYKQKKYFILNLSLIFKEKGNRRTGKGWGKVKPGSRPVGRVEEQTRVDKREEEYSDVLSRLDDLGDPYNDMNIDEKKRHALVHFYERLKVFLFLKISFIEVPCA